MIQTIETIEFAAAITVIEPCCEFVVDAETGEPICARCGWLADEHDEA